MSDNIQAIIFNNKKWTPSKAELWLKQHNHKPIKPVHKTLNYLRYRLIPPYKDDQYMTKNLDNGIKLIIKIG